MKRTVLFESEPFLEKYLTELLKAEGHEVFALENPQDSDFMISDIKPHIILYSCDSHPVGWEDFLQKYKNIRIILISSSQITGQDVLLKPFNRQQLREKMS